MTRRALITGGVSGIGAACAAQLRRDGCEVLTADIAAGADIALDVSDPARVASVLGDVGAIDILVNSAGIVGPNMPLWEVSDQDWMATIAVNLTGAFATCRALVPGMVQRGWGRIVNIASMAAKDGNPNLSAYSAAKAGLVGMTKSLGKELAQTGVLVNAVAPAVIDTPMNAATDPDVLAYLVSRIPMGRTGQASEVAELVGWLASDRCSYSTGAVYDISGGRATY